MYHLNPKFTVSLGCTIQGSNRSNEFVQQTFEIDIATFSSQPEQVKIRETTGKLVQKCVEMFMLSSIDS